MKIGNIIALVVSVVGVLLCIPLMFVHKEKEGSFGPDSIFLMIGIWFTLLIIFSALALFIYFKVMDVVKHPAHLKEMIIMSVVIVASIILGLIISFVSGGGDPITKGDGSVYDNGLVLHMMTTGLWATMLLILSSVGLWIYNAVTKINN